MLTTRQDLLTGRFSLTEAMRKSASALSERSNLFLSNARGDKGALANAAVGVLEGYGANVYADFLDPEAAVLSAAEFGTFFHQAIGDTERLIVLLTPNVATSRWVPWELGLAHGLHRFPHVAVWPVVDDIRAPNEWVHWDYLGMYPRVERTLMGEYAVRDLTGQAMWPMGRWLAL